MSRVDLEPWMERSHGIGRVPEANVTLLPEDPYASNDNEALPYRSTTYDAKPIAVEPFPSGFIYTQDPDDDPGDINSDGAGGPGSAGLSQVYSSAYRAYLRKSQESNELRFPYPSAPPDFDGSAPTNPDAVADHVRSLAASYNSAQQDPTPYDMHRYLFTEAAAAFAALHSNANTSNPQTTLGDIENTPHLAGGVEAMGAAALSVSVTDDDSDASVEDGDDPLRASYSSPSEGVEAFALSMSLASLPSLLPNGITVLRRRLRSSPAAAALVDASTAAAALHHCAQYVAAESHPIAARCEVLSLAGTLATTRGKLCEVLRFLALLEEFHANSTAILPVMVPDAESIAAAFRVDARALCPVTSPVDCYQREPRRLRVTLPEGTTAQRFCISPDRRYLAVATLQGIAVFELATGAVLVERDFSDWGSDASEVGAASGTGALSLASSPAAGSGGGGGRVPSVSEAPMAGHAGGDSSVHAPAGSTLHIRDMRYTEDGMYIVATLAEGVRHIVFSGDLSVRRELVSSTVALRVTLRDGVLDTVPVPLLPSGCTTHSLKLLSDSAPVFIWSERQAADPCEELVLCAHVGSDFSGTLACVFSENDTLTVRVADGMVMLTQSEVSCNSDVPTQAPWLFLHVRWFRGAWSLSVNGRVMELHGPRHGQAKVLQVVKVACMHGCGRLGSFTLWRGAGDSGTAVRTFSRERRLESGVRPLVHLPLDEGMGLWLKEMVSGACVTLVDAHFLWDGTHPVPCCASPVTSVGSLSGRGAPPGPTTPPPSAGHTPAQVISVFDSSDDGSSLFRTAVRMDEAQLATGQVISSAFRTLIVIPLSTRGSDDAVLEVDAATNTIVRVYRCPRTCSENLYAMPADESELVVFQPRFTTFSSSQLFTTCNLEHELGRRGLLTSDAVAGSAPWLLHEMYKRLYLESAELYRVPAGSPILSTGNLRRLTCLLAEVKASAERLRVVALLSLTWAYFERLITHDERELSRLAGKLKGCAARVLVLYSDPLIQSLASQLLSCATRKSLTLQDKVAALLDADPDRSAAVLKDCLTREALLSVVQHIAAVDPEQLTAVAQRLLVLCRAEEQQSLAEAAGDPSVMQSDGFAGGGGDAASAGGGCDGSGAAETVSDATPPSITRLMTWFVLASVTVLRASGRTDVLSKLLQTFVEYLAASVSAVAATGARARPRPERTVLHTGCLPLLTLIADLCPEAVTTATEDRLLAFVDILRSEGGGGLESRAYREAARETRVAFRTREACDVYPSEKESLRDTWRLALDYQRAESVSVHKEAWTADLFIVRSATAAQPVPAVVTMTAEQPFVRLPGGMFFFHGEGENTFTVVAQFVLTVNGSWTALLLEALTHLLISHAGHLTRRSLASETYVPPFMRNGLNSEALLRHGIHLPGRDQPSRLADSILKDTAEGASCVNQVFQSMRGSIVPSMRPAIQALLAILVHGGASVPQAEDELKLRWFSGDWGSKLQGPARDATRTFLHNLAAWVTGSLSFQPDGGLASSVLGASASMHRRLSSDRRYEASMNMSHSISERRGSTSSRRSMLKTAQHADMLDQVRTLLSKEVDTAELERVLAERTHAALQMTRGLSVLLRLLPSPAAGAPAASERVMQQVLRALWGFANVDSGAHFLDSLSGAGVDLEARVRGGFHAVLGRCSELLLGSCPKTVAPQSVLSDRAVNGSATMLLLGILCHPWDVTDCEIFNASFGTENDLLRRLEEQMNIPTCSLKLTNPWRLRREGKMALSEPDERAVRAELMGAADMNSLSRLFPNGFSVIIPQLETSRSESGIIIEKGGTSAVVLRADEGWPLTWRDGVPRVLYFETKVNSPVQGLHVGLLVSRADRALSTDLTFYYSSTGNTHMVRLPVFGTEDVIGCGLITTSRRLFFTLNGKLLSLFAAVSEKHDTLFPALRFDERAGVKVLVNFGTAPFAYDFRQLHPALTIRDGPTWYRVASTAEITLHYMTTRACAIQESRRPSARVMLSHCCEVVCRNVNAVTSSLMNIGVVGSETSSDSGKRIKQAVIFAVAEYSLLMLIATMRQVVNSGAAHGPLPDLVGEMIFDATSVLMLLPLHSIQIATISLLPEVIPHVRQVSDGATSANLVGTLFEHAKGPSATHTREPIPFVPAWRECDSRCMSIASVQYAYMVPEAQRSIVLGNPLPRTGVVSFTVKINRRNISKGHSLKGGYFIGVAIAGLTPLSPTSNSQSWKAVKPPIAWAIHDTSPQLPHATNPTVRPNNFQRTFGNDDEIRVVVDRDKRTIDFYRDGEFLNQLFNDVRADVELVPFVQLYNDDSSTLISPGEMTAPISASTLLSAASVDVLRAMLTLEPFQHLVAKGICKELDTRQYPKVTLALFNSVPDPRVLQLSSGAGDGIFVKVSRVSDMRCKFSIGDEANYEHIYNLRVPADPKITCTLDTSGAVMALRGLQLCVARLIAALRRLVHPLVTLKALCCLEQEKRQSIIDEEKERWDFLFHGLRVSSFINIQQTSQLKSLITVARIPHDFTFSASLSNPNFFFSPIYCGRLATVPSGARNATPPFIAIAEPAIPSQGRFSIRCQLIRGHNGQILGGGYYFGVCTESLNWKRKDLNSPTPEAWAFHDMDDAPWRLRHMRPSASFPITAEPRCIIVSGDIIRLEINRDEGTMHVFRKPMNAEEVPLGLIYDRIPKDVKLYPFVHLFNVDAVAVLLPTNSNDPAVRLTVQQPHFATWSTNERRYCDGCAASHAESKLTHRWFKCNECADYALCKNCFDLCVHSHHAFTEMGVPYFAYSTSPPTQLQRGMQVVLPGTSCMYLRSSGCRMHGDQMNCVAEAVEDNGFAIWALVCKHRGQFTAVVDTTDGEPLSMDHPMFIGIGSAQEVMQLSRERLRGRCFSSSSSIVSLSSDSTMRRKMEGESRQPYGFKRGSTISIEVDFTKKTVSFVRDWILVGTQSIEFAVPPGTSGPAVCCFVMFGKKNARVSVFPERMRTVLATVEETHGSIVRVVSPLDGRMRYVRADNCRVPLRPHPKVAPPVGRLGYIFVERQLFQCRVVAAAKDEVQVLCPQRGVEYTIPTARLLVDDGDVLAEERLVDKDTGEQGCSLESGFVISRLLLILSCLCENDTMSSLVMAHCGEVTSLLRSLSSVHIGNEAPLDFLQEIRASVASSAGCVRATSGNEYLRSFVPTLSVDDRKRKFRPGILVRRVVDRGSDATALSGGSTASTVALSKTVYRVRSRKGEMLSVENIDSGERAELSFKACIPVKQSGERPWFELSNGLPSSLLEHTVRVTNPTSPPKNLSIDGEWQAEVTFAKVQGVSIDLTLVSQEVSALLATDAFAQDRAPSPSRSSTATVRLAQRTVRATVLFAHERYGRSVSMCLVPESNALLIRRLADLRADESLSWPEKFARALHTAPQYPLDEIYLISADVDAEGLRMNGVCRTSDGKTGTFAANWASRISFAPATTEVAHVEPLPDCADAVIPAPPLRTVCDTMHRLIILLARHLYLVMCHKIQSVSKDFVEHIFLFHTHPLTDRLASHLVGVPNLYFMVSEACQLLIDPGARPWDAATLSSLVTKTLLLRPDVVRAAPDCLVWDTLHAVVVAAHRCGCYYRHQILRSITRFVQSQPDAPQSIYTQLFAALFSYVDSCALSAPDYAEARKDISAGVDLVLAVTGPLQQSVKSVPTQPLRCLVDLWRSISEGRPLPSVVDTAVNCARDAVESTEVFAECAFGDFKNDELRVGKVNSSCAAGLRGRYYYEVVLPDPLSSPFALGWGTEAHCDVPSQHVGSDRSSFSFNGADISMKDLKEEYKIGSEVMPGSVVGCLLDMDTRTVAWSVNGYRGSLIPIPITLRADDKLLAFASIGTCNGMQVRLRASQFEYVPDGYTDLSHRFTRVLIDSYDSQARSSLAVCSLSFYTQLAAYLSDIDEHVEEAPYRRPRDYSFATVAANNHNASLSLSTVTPRRAAEARGVSEHLTAQRSLRQRRSGAGSLTTVQGAVSGGAAAAGASGDGAPLLSASTRAASCANVNDLSSASVLAAAAATSFSGSHAALTVEDLYLPKYQALVGLPRAQLEDHARVIAAIESCMATANRFVDLDGDEVSGDLSLAFVYLKPLVRRSFRQKLLVNIPGVERVSTPPTIAIRATELYSTLPRTPEVALQHTVLSQLYRQIGSYTEAQWAFSPLFKVNLYISGSGHTPIDMGGPYRQVWTFLAEEMMRHPDKCYPHSDFHRNPLFVFVNNSQRVSLVPGSQANAACELALFNFFGKIMGHAARAKFPLDIDFSAFLWKFLVDDTLTIRDYYQHVDSVVETSMEDDNFLLSGIAEEIIPGFAEKIMWMAEDNVGEQELVRRRRELGESCLVHSMDEQLGALRSGLWSVLPRRVVRCLSWRDLEKLVCGETNPSVDDLRRYIRSQLSSARDRFFWQIVEQMTAEQKASLLCFASGQRRLPLIRPISVQENNESVEHLPRAQSCSSLITVPAYTSLEVFREKLFIALQHQAEMELA